MRWSMRSRCSASATWRCRQRPSAGGAPCKTPAQQLVSRAQRSTKRSGVVRCRPGTPVSFEQTITEVPDLRCTVSRCTAPGTRAMSFRLDVPVADGAGVFVVLAADVGAKVLAAGADDLESLRQKFRLDVGRLQRRGEHGRKLCDRVLRG